MKITAIDRKALQYLRGVIDSALEELSNKHGWGIELKLANGTYNGTTNGHYKLSLNLIDDSGAVMTEEAEDFKRYAELYGLKPEWLGESFTYSSVKRGSSPETYKIIGFKARARKRQILTEDSTGKRQVWPANNVLELMERQAGKNV